MLVDAHVHVVSSDTTRYPLRPSGIGSERLLQVSAPVQEFEAAMHAAGLDAAVLVQAMGAYGTDNSYLLEVASGRQSQFAAVVIVDLNEAGASSLPRWRTGSSSPQSTALRD
jgi:predicted TIM-barrel fold metal-dependent hydrolase